ncbi:MAG: aldehyde dehydrogenase family protein, partial [Rhodobacteraceae bacterium]|nr:aldehyde dehydrogenase family protein [Paracoccaceae bacterium]
MPHSDILAAAGLTQAELTGGSLSVTTPVDGSEIARLKPHSTAEAEAQIAAAKSAFKSWRLVPAPRRGELVRLLGE